MSNEFQNAIKIGQVLLTNTVFPRLEAFSGNALYCERGIPTMNKYKTVKEVCDLTGLTRKHLYYFHHTKVVQAVAYANYSVEGNDGYKLYDDAAVEKLQQIALYYQLGLKRDEILDIMMDPNYDSNLVLDTLLAIEQSKKATIDRHIAALEYLKLIGTKNRLLSPLRGMSLKELGETILTLRNSVQVDTHFTSLTKAQSEAFTMEFLKYVSLLNNMDSEAIPDAANGTIEKIFAVSQKYLGSDGVPFALGFFVSAIGLGPTPEDLQITISPDRARAVICYFVKHPERYKTLSETHT
jgi:DNA-binding transcriptional MerR regulator